MGVNDREVGAPVRAVHGVAKVQNVLSLQHITAIAQGRRAGVVHLAVRGYPTETARAVLGVDDTIVPHTVEQLRAERYSRCFYHAPWRLVVISKRVAVQRIQMRWHRQRRAHHRREGQGVVPPTNSANAPLQGRHATLEVSALAEDTRHTLRAQFDVRRATHTVNCTALRRRHIDEHTLRENSRPHAQSVRATHGAIVHLGVLQSHVHNGGLDTQANVDERHNIRQPVLVAIRRGGQRVLVVSDATLRVDKAAPAHEHQVRARCVAAHLRVPQSMLNQAALRCRGVNENTVRRRHGAVAAVIRRAHRQVVGLVVQQLVVTKEAKEHLCCEASVCPVVYVVEAGRGAQSGLIVTNTGLEVSPPPPVACEGLCRGTQINLKL